MHSSGGKDGVTAGLQLHTHYHWDPSPLQVVGSLSLGAVLLLRRGLRGPRMPSETNVRLKQKSLFCALGIQGSPPAMKKRQMGTSHGRRLSRDFSDLSLGHFRKCAETKGILKSEGPQFLQEDFEDGLKSTSTVLEPKAFVQST